MPRRHIQANQHAVREWQTHVNTWDICSADQDTKDWLGTLRSGDTVQVFARAQYPGWCNYVRRVDIEIEGVGPGAPSEDISP